MGGRGDSVGGRGDSVGGRRENEGNEMIGGKRPTDRSKRGE